MDLLFSEVSLSTLPPFDLIRSDSSTEFLVTSPLLLLRWHAGCTFRVGRESLFASSWACDLAPSSESSTPKTGPQLLRGVLHLHAGTSCTHIRTSGNSRPVATAARHVSAPAGATECCGLHVPSVGKPLIGQHMRMQVAQENKARYARVFIGVSELAGQYDGYVWLRPPPPWIELRS